MSLRLFTACIGTLALALAGKAATRSDELAEASNGGNWAAYGRTYNENHFSPLTQIAASNVSRLGLAWAVDLPTVISTHAAPLAVDGTLYFATGLSVISARNARDGRLLWTYDPGVPAVVGEKLRPAWGIRGMAYWRDKIYVGTQDGRLLALNAKHGSLIWSAQSGDAAVRRTERQCTTRPASLFTSSLAGRVSPGRITRSFLST